jgi:nucleoside 2-deoxyribosyltransferase
VVYAWIDTLDCYGTIVELGYAKALEKEIWIAGPRRFRDMWFVYELASFVEDEAADALSGSQSCIGNVARKHIPA